MDLPRLIFFSRNFPPLVGGIEGLMHSVFLCLKDEYDIVLIGPKGCKDCSDGADRVYELPVNIIGYLAAALCLIPFLFLSSKPALVMGSNGLMAPLVAILSKLSRGPSVCFLHGLDIIVESRFYRFVFLPFVRRIDTIVVNSTNTKELALRAGLPAEAIEIVHPCIKDPLSSAGVDTLLVNANDGVPIIVYAGRIVPRKGLLEFIQECAHWLRSGKYKLIIAGDEPFGQAGAGVGSYAQRLQQTIVALELGDSIEFLGRVSDDEMAAAFFRASVHVMPLVEVPGDVEGFGMVAVEAATYGVPTVAFDIGGVRDALPSDKYLIPPGKYSDFMRAVDSITHSDHDAEDLIEWARGFSMAAFRPKLLGVLSRAGSVSTADN